MILQRTHSAVRFAPPVLTLLIAAAAGIGLAAQDNKPDTKTPKPSIVVRASPSISFSPARVFVVAEVRGGPDDNEELYCASVEWDWGDGTKSENSYDCEPYEAGKSEIKRRFAVEHVYRLASDYRIQFRLKKKDKPVLAGRTTVKVRPGLREPGIGNL
ncbi:MAG: hypothetical protein LC804_11585 [Acidobacteria bacterium]|nr:hypothetical protein [Acidobacteriota bacterium]